MILTGRLRPPARHRKHTWCDDHTLALRAATDYQWRNEYRRAEHKVRDAALGGRTWVKVKLPFAVDDEMESWYEWVLSVASFYGFERRPGGPSGNSTDLVFFERTGAA
jgi:hypothetical protein